MENMREGGSVNNFNRTIVNDEWDWPWGENQEKLNPKDLMPKGKGMGSMSPLPKKQTDRTL
jgi:hypothetical protein